MWRRYDAGRVDWFRLSIDDSHSDDKKSTKGEERGETGQASKKREV